jgi:hypothetical protein
MKVSRGGGLGGADYEFFGFDLVVHFATTCSLSTLKQAIKKCQTPTFFVNRRYLVKTTT